ncbi:uncharacterized protein LOC124369234 isoform X2 [Homalodisca vitripennis]|uniref:uncharacterized protein LOC124369234 isoform X2 n=1 Tax=Homalodisca vitripennis TaxID=197043 RepID=UPI001EEBED1B|nr:uncharacterized protein LOC124369234 isoform X2 [Homalodisca vitripennis]
MGSLYIMITVPSLEHEKSLWLEKNLGVQKHKKTISFSIEPNKSSSDVADNNKPSPTVLDRSLSDDSSMEKVGDVQSTNKERSQSDTHMPKIKNALSMEKRLENCLKELKIPNAVWVLGSQGKYHQVSFCTQAGEKCELIMQLLTENEIGVELNSTVSILPCSLYYEGKEHTLTPNRASRFPTSHKYAKELTAWERFIHSVRDRLMIAQVVTGVKNNAVFTFDFLVLLVIASFTAAVGLVENSVVILVASMLISPLMGPVMASTFGFVTKDWKLQKIGVLNELMGLLLCVLIGFLYGLIIGCLSWESPDVAMWPTPEMISSGNLRSLWVGALTALTSGAAVAIAVLGDYSGSLTGVAISASLMPSAVNAGLLWATAAVAIMFTDSECQLSTLRSGEPVRELLLLGALSLALTFINIACIFIMGIIVLKIKEVTPQGSKDYSKFLWKETIQMTQDFKYSFSQSADRMEQGSVSNQQPDVMSDHPNRFGLNQYTWSAYGALQDFNRPSIRDLVTAWKEVEVNEPNIAETNQNTHVKGILRGSPHPRASNLTRLWSVMSSPATASYMSFSDNGSPMPSSLQHTSLYPHKFTVTPADVNSTPN